MPLHEREKLCVYQKNLAKPAIHHSTSLEHGKFHFMHNGHLGFLRSRGFVSYSSGDKKETLAPLVFFGTTGTMLDIIMGITQCEREHAEHQAKLLEDQTSATDASFAEIGAE
ncbi:hypothetical protein ACFX10_035737 [Malus domestica]